MRAIMLAFFAILGPGFGAISTGGGTAPAPHSISPTKVAWYDAGRPTAVTPAAPMPGVGPKDVVVAGLTINAALLPISLPLPTLREVTAFTALQFQLPDGATPATLTLHLTGLTTAAIAGKLPSGVTPIACPATSKFKAGAQQPSSAAPKYDCSKRSTVGQLSAGGKTVTFPGISRLLTGNKLSVVILPGSLGLERLIFSPPDAKTLSLLSFDSTPGITTGPVPLPTPSTSSPAGVGSSGSIPTLPLPPLGGIPTPVISQPVIAPSSPAIATAALSKPDDHRERIAAIGMLVALVVMTMWFTLTDRGGQPLQEWGVGRFRSERSGPPPTL